MNSPALTPTSN